LCSPIEKTVGRIQAGAWPADASVFLPLADKRRAAICASCEAVSGIRKIKTCGTSRETLCTRRAAENMASAG
jgi:hypothetical protein